MSHERTPFHGILGAITLARSRMVEPKGKELLDRAKNATNHLLRVINDILDISVSRRSAWKSRAPSSASCPSSKISPACWARPPAARVSSSPSIWRRTWPPCACWGIPAADPGAHQPGSAMR
ncbi:MAG: hypothetical protein IPJ99_01095 [Betaproteobacteria bacterium]|nr:hypothetical protein [Betaproteobacteria bacterium]